MDGLEAGHLFDLRSVHFKGLLPYNHFSYYFRQYSIVADRFFLSFHLPEHIFRHNMECHFLTIQSCLLRCPKNTAIFHL